MIKEGERPNSPKNVKKVQCGSKELRKCFGKCYLCDSLIELYYSFQPLCKYLPFLMIAELSLHDCHLIFVIVLCISNNFPVSIVH